MHAFFQKLYVRIWLAVVLAVAVLTLLVGWAWRMASEPPLREVVPNPETEAVAPSALCTGAAPSSLALLHRQDTVDLMLFPRGAEVTALGEPCLVVALQAP